MSIENGLGAMERLKFVLGNIGPRIQEVGTLEAVSSMKAAVFNNGETSTGAPIGAYKSATYKRKREKAGRQIAKVDLEFTGELRNALDRGTLGGKLVVGWTNSEAAQIASYLEQRYKNIIFAPQPHSIKRIGTLAEVELNRMLKENGF